MESLTPCRNRCAACRRLHGIEPLAKWHVNVVPISVEDGMKCRRRKNRTIPTETTNKNLPAQTSSWIDIQVQKTTSRGCVGVCVLYVGSSNSPLTDYMYNVCRWYDKTSNYSNKVKYRELCVVCWNDPNYGSSDCDGTLLWNHPIRTCRLVPCHLESVRLHLCRG